MRKPIYINCFLILTVKVKLNKEKQQLKLLFYARETYFPSLVLTKISSSCLINNGT